VANTNTASPPKTALSLQPVREQLRAARFAMRMSLTAGVVILLAKTTAYYVTGPQPSCQTLPNRSCMSLPSSSPH
jgi:hypothetical protein